MDSLISRRRTKKEDAHRPTISTSAVNNIISELQPWVALTRVSKFAGTMIVFWPYAWGLTMSARTETLPLPKFLVLLLAGFVVSALSHSAGCVWNDILDRNFDSKVERTKGRPIASGKISVAGALIFLFVHVFLMFSVVWTVNQLAWNIGLLSLFFAAVYPFMKRVTYWPQAWLGLTANTGVTMAWACVTGALPMNSLVLTVGGCSWSLWYDTIYACQDWKDDVKAGVKSTALLFGSRVKTYMVLFGSILMGAVVASGIMNNQGLPFFAVSVLGGAMHLTWQLNSVDVNSPKSCWKMFHVNGFYFGAVVETGLLLDYLYVLNEAKALPLI